MDANFPNIMTAARWTESHAASEAADRREVTLIEAPSGWWAFDFVELWRYRELLWFLALRDIQVRYKQTALGAAWALLQPLLTMVAFTIFFGRLAGLDQRSSVPYPLLAFCALLPWQLFEYALLQSSMSLVNSERLVTKVYFPRLVIPLASVAAGLLDFAIACGLLLAMMAYYGVAPGWPLLTLPLFVLFALAAALAVGLWLSALNAQYRDVRHMLPFVARFWLFMTPVAYTSDLLPPRWRTLFGLNPLTGVVEGFRWALLGAAEPPGWQLVVSALITSVLLVGGLYYFRRMAATFADVI